MPKRNPRKVPTRSKRTTRSGRPIRSMRDDNESDGSSSEASNQSWSSRSTQTRTEEDGSNSDSSTEIEAEEVGGYRIISADDSISGIRPDQIFISFEVVKSKKIHLTTQFKTSYSVNKKSLETLNDQSYLNDDIVDFYLQYILDRLVPKEIAKKTYIFNSFFFSKMMETKSNIKDPSEKNHLYFTVYESVKNWTKNVNVFQYDFIIMPICLKKHWWVAIICYAKKLLITPTEDVMRERPCIVILDSIDENSNHAQTILLIKNWLQNEIQLKHTADRVVYEDQLPVVIPLTPTQANDYDCGIFVLRYVEEFLKNPGKIFGCRRLASVSLNDWFDVKSMDTRRLSIAKNLINLYKENPISDDDDDDDDGNEEIEDQSENDIEVLDTSAQPSTSSGTGRKFLRNRKKTAYRSEYSNVQSIKQPISKEALDYFAASSDDDDDEGKRHAESFFKNQKKTQATRSSNSKIRFEDIYSGDSSLGPNYERPQENVGIDKQTEESNLKKTENEKSKEHTELEQVAIEQPILEQAHNQPIHELSTDEQSTFEQPTLERSFENSLKEEQLNESINMFNLQSTSNQSLGVSSSKKLKTENYLVDDVEGLIDLSYDDEE